MKTSTFVLLCFLGVLAIIGFGVAQSQNGLCDNYGCSMDCFEQGLHGECDYEGMCTCRGCIYRACKRMCAQSGRVGQCDEAECLCL